jgi:arsenate reductase
MTVEKVVFACVQNAGRSQIAAAYFNHMTNPDLARAVSAGTRPAARVHREVVTAMREVGIDLSLARPALLTEELARGAKWLITMGCGEECPVVPGARREDWPIPDPAGQDMVRVREIRSEIQARVRELIAREAWWRLRPGETHERPD